MRAIMADLYATHPVLSTLADEAVDSFLAFLDGPGAVEKHAADQLLLPLALAGGKVSVDSGRCIFCGYCATVCRDFVIKVI